MIGMIGMKHFETMCSTRCDGMRCRDSDYALHIGWMDGRMTGRMELDSFI